MESTFRNFAPNPRIKASILSLMFSTWTVPLFKKGYTKGIELGDIFQPFHCEQSDVLGDRLEANWKKLSSKTTKPPSLIKTIFKTYWKELGNLVILFILSEPILRTLQPLFLSKLLIYFREDSKMEYNDALIYAIGLIIISGLYPVLFNHFISYSSNLGTKIRVSVCSLIFRKALRLSQVALSETSMGKIVNMLSNDVRRFEITLLYLNYMITPLFALIICVLLWLESGIAGMIGVLIILIVVFIQSYTSKLTSRFRLKTALQTDERVRFMNEIISGIHVIKTYAWELPFGKIVDCARQIELKMVRKALYIRALSLTFILCTNRMAIFSAMLAIALLYGSDQITADKVFAISSYYSIIAQLMSERFVRGIAELAEILVGLKRLQNFLELSEKDNDRVCGQENGNKQEDVKMSATATNHCIPEDVAISIRNGVAHWTMPIVKNRLQNGFSKPHENEGFSSEPETQILKPPTLNEININFTKGKLIGIIGSVGAGKSSLLQVLLRELPLESGSLTVDGSIAYASQEPWLFAGSIRQNILFGEDYDQDKYNAVIDTCALIKDFKQLKHGDGTIVGDHGASLSGGQKARLNLARACYRKADIYLLDDPLSAVDAHVGTHIFNKCFGPKGRLARLNATRILVTHQVHFLKEADWIVVLNEGKIEVQGTPVELLTSEFDFAKFLGTNYEPEIEENCGEFERKISRSNSIALSNLDGSECNGEKIDEKMKGVEMESSSKGTFKGSVSVNYFKSGAHWSTLFVLCISIVIVQVLANAADYWVSIWIRQEEIRFHNRNYNISNTNRNSENSLDTAIHSLIHTSFTFSTTFCVNVHITILVSLFLLSMLRSIGFYSMCLRISKNLHNAMFNGLISTPMRFFDTNPSGRMLNRFSKDIGIIDETFPRAILDTIHIIFNLIGTIAVTAIVNSYFLVPIFIMGFFFIFIRHVYLKTSKNIMRLRGITASPIFTHMAATLSGLSTVRAYNAEKILQTEFDRHQDINSACLYTSIAIVTSLNLALDIVCFMFLSCIILYYTLINTHISGDKVGLAITQAMSLGGILQYGIRQSADIINHFISVERVLEYRDLEPEKQPQNPCKTSENWPSKGCIEFRNVFYRYFDGSEPVLRGLSFVIKSKEKIGIVGRTGAGKSSLIGAIFRLACIEGNVLIDDVDTATLQLRDLRKRIAIIPQEPVLFSGTLRRNLDPFEEYTDDDIWIALEQVGLKEIASGSLGLHSPVLAHGSNFSVGQRQLLCLARVTLRKNRILVLDEATAHIDPQTDQLIQQTIRVRFADCTVLTVAHRLNTIMDSDRVLVIDAGRVAEFDMPHKLLNDETGIFYGMAKALGPHEYNRLSQVAQNKFNSNHTADFEDTRL